MNNAVGRCTHRGTTPGCTQGRRHSGGTRQGANGKQPALPLHAAEGVRIILLREQFVDPASAWFIVRGGQRAIS